MNKRMAAVLAVAAMMLGMLAGPAAALDFGDVGVFAGTATVGKNLTGGGCTNGDQSGTPTGAGLGFPIVQGATNNKAGWWKIDTSTPFVVQGNTVLPAGFLTTLLHGNGTLVACGKLGPAATLKKGALLALGASCGISTGHSGFGTAIGKKLEHLGWLTSAGGTLPVTGRQVDAATKKVQGHVVALTQAQGGSDCATKSGSGASKTGGATKFAVVGVFALVQ